MANIKSSYKLYNDDCLSVLNTIPEKSINLIFADPPYKLSNDGITCKSGKVASVNKGIWDRSSGFSNDHRFNVEWLTLCDKVLDDNGTIWVSGTYHIIHSIACALYEMGYYILNEIVWYKPNAAPNMGCRCFTASHELLLWAKKDKRAKHTFNYNLMKELNGGKQMRSIWEIPTTPKREKAEGYHPTQKPLSLISRCILASSNEGDTVLDPFCGSGTTGVAAIRYKRNFIGIEADKEYFNLSSRRLQIESNMLYNI
ncbi:MAG: DNA-methyltransferase [Caldicoprobacterales bacterium]|jgi:site-specific DNA-methyltransferase (adenine-specific)|nr:site-specific DNA-methyltransferase [Clostridiales bacterium]